MQIFQRPRLTLGRTCRQRRLLRKFNKLLFGRFVAVISHKFCLHPVKFSANIAAPGGKSTHHLVANANDFMDRFAVLHPGLELQTRQLRDVFLDFTVIKLRAFDPVLIQNSAVNRRPFIICAFNTVGNHDVIVQVRIACPGVVVTEFRTNNSAFGVDLPYPVMAPPGHNHIRF